jgi:elongation factor G
MSGKTVAFPLIEIKIEPKIKADWPIFASAIAASLLTNPDAFITIDNEKHEALIGGTSELQINCIVGELKDRGVELDIGAPQIAYRETITRKAMKDYTHKMLNGGVGQFARVILELEPVERGLGNLLESRAVAAAVPKKYQSGVEKGLNSVLSCGPLAGFPITDLKVTLIDGAYHDVDSSAVAFEIASRAAMREAFETAGAVLLEPIMNVEIIVPEKSLSAVINDLHLRGGQIVGASTRGDDQIINAFVSLANMFGYALILNSLSKGLARFTMEYSHYSAIIQPHAPDNFPPAIGMRA